MTSEGHKKHCGFLLAGSSGSQQPYCEEAQPAVCRGPMVGNEASHQQPGESSGLRAASPAFR